MKIIISQFQTLYVHVQQNDFHFRLHSKPFNESISVVPCADEIDEHENHVFKVALYLKVV